MLSIAHIALAAMASVPRRKGATTAPESER
jgi:hypothetical protein